MARHRRSVALASLAHAAIARAAPRLARPAAAGGAQCGELVYGRGFGANLPGKPQHFAASAQGCCAFCHATPNWPAKLPPPPRASHGESEPRATDIHRHLMENPNRARGAVPGEGESEYPNPSARASVIDKTA